MKSHKTPQRERGTYTYHFDDGRSITIKPGEEGVTEEEPLADGEQSVSEGQLDGEEQSDDKEESDEEGSG